MARNRKRAKERRARRPQPVATARTQRQETTPSPLGHAAPDAELADAQLALGRPEPEPAEDPSVDTEPDSEEEIIVAEELGEGPEIPGVLPARPRVERGEVAPAEVRAPEPRARAGNRLINFLQGSWRELQRVQWPDRRQVIQATGVVIGFVIIAGLFLGLADTVASKIMNFILK